MQFFIDNLTLILFIFVFMTTGLLVATLFLWQANHKKNKAMSQLNVLKEEHANQLNLLKGELNGFKQTKIDLEQRITGLEENLTTLRQNNINLEKEKATLITKYEELKQKETTLTTQFEDLARKILDENSKKLNEASTVELGKVLNPFKERIVEFQNKVDEVYGKEREQRTSLKDEINKMVQMQEATRSTAEGLTKALKGDNKQQGNWGEIQLERILEESGLREELDYTLQGAGMGLFSDEGKKQMPDVVINLPDKKTILVDAKVNLVHYTNYVNATDEEKEGYLKQFIGAVKSQIDNLSGKAYHSNVKLETVDFTIMFMPIESAYMLAIDKEPTLHSEAWKKKIVLCNPSGLFAMLKTIAYAIGNKEREKNYDEVIRQTIELYDKFVGFVDDMEQFGSTLDKTKKYYDAAMNKLSTGAGNLVKRVENIKIKGRLNTKKALKKELLGERAEVEPTPNNPPLLDL